MEMLQTGHNDVIPIMHCFDNNYVIPAAASFWSMLKHADPHYNYRLYVLHTDITSQNREKLSHVVAQFPNASLEFIDMGNRFNDVWEKLQFQGHFSKEVLYKLLLPSIFPQYDRMIVTDVDVVFEGDITPSFFAIDGSKQDYSHVYFAGVRQIMPEKTWLEEYYANYREHFGADGLSKLKICGGYFVANLTALRADNMEERFIAWLKKQAYRLLQSEQDAINFCTEEENIIYLPLGNVVCSYMYDIFAEGKNLGGDPFYTAEQLTEAMEHPIQLHYATGTKPWNKPESTKADRWYYYLSQSGMYYDFVQRKEATRNDTPDRIEPELIRGSEPENHSPMGVSVLCCSYNHERMIRRTLEGILTQKTNFAFEVIVSDDASTDGTQNIIREYIKKYPNQMEKCVLRTQNVGIGCNYYEALQKVSGRYLAICDGDDEWLDPEKLQKQYDYLERHRECTVCCSSFYIHNEGESTGENILFDVEKYISQTREHRDLYLFEDLLYCHFIASCTVMMRWQLRNRVPRFLMYYRTIDFPLELIHAACGGIHVMNDEAFSQYNRHAASLTSGKTDYDGLNEMLNVLREVNQFLQYSFNRPVESYIHLCLTPQKQKKSTRDEKEKGEGKPHRSFLRMLYDELVPLAFKRLLHWLLRWPQILYRELCPNALKRLWRLIKRAARTWFYKNKKGSKENG